MIIKNAKIRGQENTADIYIKDGLIEKIEENITVSGEEVIDAEGNFVSAPYVDSHCHLDYVGTSGLYRPNMSGTLFEAIEIIGETAKMLSPEDMKVNARKIIRWQIANGTQFIRSHINTDEEGLKSLKALLEVREEFRDYVTIQFVAFPQHGIFKYPNALANMEKALQMGVDVIGAIPHYEDTREDGVASVKEIFKLAKKYHTLVDVHCDEIDDDQSRFLEVVASEAIKNELFDKVTASHTTAMGSYNNAYTFKLFSLLKRSKINIICNATINTTLQGRCDTYPKRRGLTRVKELLAEGINVSMGTDDIVDPCYPLGIGDMAEVLNMALHVCHLTGHQELYDSFHMITDNGARTLNLGDTYGIEAGKAGNMIILSGKDELDVLRRHAVPLYSIHEGKVIAVNRPRTAEVYLDDSYVVDFALM